MREIEPEGWPHCLTWGPSLVRSGGLASGWREATRVRRGCSVEVGCEGEARRRLRALLQFPREKMGPERRDGPGCSWKRCCWLAAGSDIRGEGNIWLQQLGQPDLVYEMGKRREK